MDKVINMSWCSTFWNTVYIMHYDSRTRSTSVELAVTLALYSRMT